MEGVDFISNLPDPLLIAIVSLLPGTEGVRTSILSQQWKTIWKNSSHLSFDQRKMLKESIENYLRDTSPLKRLEKAMLRKKALREKEVVDGIVEADMFINLNVLREEEVVDAIAEASMLINSVVDDHIGRLKSCNIRHLPESSVSGEVEGWMRKLLKKGVRKISMERELDCPISMQKLKAFHRNMRRTINLPFDIFSGFEVLELKNYYLKTLPSSNTPQFLKTLTLIDMNVPPSDFRKILSHCSSLENLTLENCYLGRVMIRSPSLKFFKICNMFVSRIMVYAVNIEVIEIDTIFCNAKKLAFKTPKLQVLRSYYDMKKKELNFLATRDMLLTTENILEAHIDNLIHHSSISRNLFENLVTLVIKLDLKNFKVGRVLSSALKTCQKLENLEINSQVDGDCAGVYNQNEDDDIFPHKHIFWQNEFSKGICHHLKTLSIKGFIGKDFEVEFVKYMITYVETMKKITIWFADDSTWAEATTTLCLLVYPRASTKLSITLKPGVEYMTKFGGNFQKWVSTLRD